jgi:hypothetical protein
MKRIAVALGLACAVASLGRAQQDTTKPAAPAATTPAASLSVEAVVAKTVMDRMPQDTGVAFPPDVGQLWLWTKVTGAPEGAETVIHHVWFHGDEQVGDVELRVGGSPWRTYSRKTIPAEWTGPWHVEVRDASGAVLTRIDFTVG